jgi:hypothetical protein
VMRSTGCAWQAEGVAESEGADGGIGETLVSGALIGATLDPILRAGRRRGAGPSVIKGWRASEIGG